MLGAGHHLVPWCSGNMVGFGQCRFRTITGPLPITSCEIYVELHGTSLDEKNLTWQVLGRLFMKTIPIYKPLTLSGLLIQRWIKRAKWSASQRFGSDSKHLRMRFGVSGWPLEFFMVGVLLAFPAVEAVDGLSLWWGLMQMCQGKGFFPHVFRVSNKFLGESAKNGRGVAT